MYHSRKCSATCGSQRINIILTMIMSLFTNVNYSCNDHVAVHDDTCIGNMDEVIAMTSASGYAIVQSFLSAFAFRLCK